jgi:hypothetical protein
VVLAANADAHRFHERLARATDGQTRTFGRGDDLPIVRYARDRHEA